MAFRTDGSMHLVQRGTGGVQVWGWTHTDSGYALQPRGAAKADGRIVGAADGGKTSTLSFFGTASRSAEGDARFKVGLDLATSNGISTMKLGCIAANVG